jgi:hypothetical protein
MHKMVVDMVLVLMVKQQEYTIVGVVEQAERKKHQ